MSVPASDLFPTGVNYNIPPFARACLDHARDAWVAAHEHPFVEALIEGSLDRERFKFYQMQDARYLESFADACSIVSTRVNDPDDKLWFIDAARMGIVVEGELHAGYGEQLGYDPDDIAGLELTPNNHAYQTHMIAAAARTTLVEATAAITPCPWLYTDLGRIILNQFDEEVPADHPYTDWLQMYTDPTFEEYMDNLLERLQRFADASDEAARGKAKEAFLRSIQYEWMFWQQAWEQQEWPV